MPRTANIHLLLRHLVLLRTGRIKLLKTLQAFFSAPLRDLHKNNDRTNNGNRRFNQNVPKKTGHKSVSNMSQILLAFAFFRDKNQFRKVVKMQKSHCELGTRMHCTETNAVHLTGKLS